MHQFSQLDIDYVMRVDEVMWGGLLLALTLTIHGIGLFLMMLNIKYDYVEKLWTHPLGIKMSVVALIMQLLGAVVIRHIVNIKV